MTTDQAGGLRTMMKDQSADVPLRVIAVASGKGGVGKTNISSNLAVIAAKAGRKVLVIDADLGLANVEVLYGITPKYHLGHLLDSSLEVEQILATGPHGVRVLSAGNGVQELSRLDDAQKMRLITALDVLEDSFDFVVLDSGAGIGDNVLFFAGAAQETVLVVSPEPTSLTDAYAALKVLTLNGGVRIFNIVVNSCPTEAAALDIFQKLSGVTSRFLDAKLRYLGSIPRDENVHRAVMSQKPLVDAFPQSPASRALFKIADTLIHEPSSTTLDGGLKFLWNRLFRESNVSADGG